MNNLTSGAGGELDSPVFDWLDAAKELEQLPAVLDQILAAPQPATRDHQRARESPVTLVHLELGENEADSACMKLHALVKATMAAGVEDQWPQVLVIWRGMHRIPGNAAVANLLTLVYSQRTLQRRPAGIYGWHNQIGSVAGLLRQHELAANNPEAKRSNPPSSWIPTSAARASTRGNGHPVVQSEWSGPRGVKYAGHNDDFLFYRYPLTGGYEVECEMTEPSHTPAQVSLGGTNVGPHWNRKELEMGSTRGSGNVPIKPPLSTFGPWVRDRGVVRNGEC